MLPKLKTQVSRNCETHRFLNSYIVYATVLIPVIALALKGN